MWRDVELSNHVCNFDVMSSVQLKLSSDDKMNMYENMVEDLVNSDDESSRYMLDGKKIQIRNHLILLFSGHSDFLLCARNIFIMMIKHVIFSFVIRDFNSPRGSRKKMFNSLNVVLDLFSLNLKKI